MTYVEEEIKRKLVDAEKNSNYKIKEQTSNNDKNNTTSGGNSKRPLYVLALDDFETIFRHTSDHHISTSEIINQLLGTVDLLQEQGYAVGIVAILNKPLDDIQSDHRIRSRIESAFVTFPTHNGEELIEILQDRKMRAFHIQAPIEVIKTCAKICCSQYGNARRAPMFFKLPEERTFASWVFSPPC